MKLFIRIMALLCVAILAAGLVACGGDDSNDSGKSDSSAESSAEEITPEEVFDKIFTAVKEYDADTLGEYEYAINFSKSFEKDEMLEKTKAGIAALDEEELKEYKEQNAETSYEITDTKTMSADERATRAAELSDQYNDTDKISEIIVFTYHTTPAYDYAQMDRTAEMIKVDGDWYCFLGDNYWNA